MSTTVTISLQPDLAPRIFLQPIRLTLTHPITDEDRDKLAEAYASRYPREHRADARRSARHALAGVDADDAGNPVLTAVAVQPAPWAAFR